MAKKPAAAVSTAVLALAFDFEQYPPTDLSHTSRVQTYFGGQITSVGNSLNNTKSFYIGANGTAYLTTADAPELEFTGDFTVEYWTAGGTATTGYQVCVSKPQTGVTDSCNIGSNGGYPYMTGNDGSIVLQSATRTTALTYVHHCFTRKNGVLRYLKMGALDTQVNYADPWGVNTNKMFFGASGSSTHATMNGYMDRLRIWQGWKYWDNFTPSSAAYPN